MEPSPPPEDESPYGGGGGFVPYTPGPVVSAGFEAAVDGLADIPVVSGDDDLEHSLP